MANLTSSAFEDTLNGGLFTFDSTTGQIIPQTQNVRAAIEAALVEAFGTNLRLDAESPAGRLVEMWTMMMARFCSVTALYANQLNPRYATGQMLDAIGSLFSVNRNGRTATVITCTFGGTPGTVIQKGSRISDNKSHVFALDNTIIIPSDGQVSSTATCATVGPVIVASGTVTQILDTISGWNTVNNTATVSVGEDIENDYHYRSRVINARWTGTAFLEDIRAELNRVAGVESVFVAENSDSVQKYLIEGMKIIGVWAAGTYNKGDKVMSNSVVYECLSDDYNSETAPSSDTEHWDALVGTKYIKMAPHSIVVIVSGSADDNDIAYAIYATKSAGCGMTELSSNYQGVDKGTRVLVPIIDSDTGVTYSITFNKPLTHFFSAKAVVVKGGYIGTDEQLAASVKSAIKAWATGEYPYVDGIQLGQSIYSYEIGAAISDAIPSIQIRQVKVFDTNGESGSETPSSYEDEIPLFVNELGVLDDDEIEVEVVS